MIIMQLGTESISALAGENALGLVF